MPIYDYECSLCHFHFERRQRFNEDPVSICPRCQGKAHRVLHSVPIFFKGGGFYTTDHGRGYSPSKEKEPEPTRKKRKDTKDTK
jgi:putative FmdB family regulatory protein